MPPDRIAALKEHNILYCRNGEGEYLQVTNTFEHRFFFEIVERRRGYDGYGAANASIRLALQAALASD